MSAPAVPRPIDHQLRSDGFRPPRLTGKHLFTPGQDDTLDRIVLCGLVELVIELDEQRGRQCVQSLGSVQGEHGHGALLVDEDELVRDGRARGGHHTGEVEAVRLHEHGSQLSGGAEEHGCRDTLGRVSEVSVGIGESRQVGVI